MSTQTTQQLLAKQNEMITELITITRDCVQACHLVIQTGKMNEIRREVQPLVNPQPLTFKRSYYRRASELKDWQVKAVELYKQGLNAAEIAMQLMVDYHTAYNFLRNHADYKPQKRRMGRITA